MEKKQNGQEWNQVDDGALVHDDVGSDTLPKYLNVIKAPPVAKQHAKVQRNVQDVVRGDYILDAVNGHANGRHQVEAVRDFLKVL